MELIGGGELFDKIAAQENQVFTEDIARGYMRKLLGACHHMHSQGVVHRDIKPENIMLDATGEIKLIDFGLSKKQKDGKKMLKTVLGTPYYMAPEVLDGKYDNKCDIWALGVLLYVFMSGYLPFQGENRADVFHKIQNVQYHFNHQEFNAVSDTCVDLIKKLLVGDPKKRLDAGQALNHPWFAQDVDFQIGPIDTVVL
jgi:calcium-dependent protein kinase